MTISGLKILLAGSAAGFVSACKEGGSAFDSFTSKVSGFAGSFAGIGSAVGIAGLALLVQHTTSAIDATAKLSNSLGISTQALTRLQYAASFAGVSSEDLSTGLKKFEKNLAEAANGTGPAAEAFAHLGLNAQQLINQSPEQAIGHLADALKGVENPSQRTALAMEILGKNGASLIPLLNQGSEAINKYSAEADKFGYSLNDVDASKVEQANAALIRLTNIGQGALNTLTIQLAPYIQAAGDKLAAFVSQGDGLTGKVVTGFEAVVKSVAYLSDYVSLAQGVFTGLQAAATTAVLGIIYVVDKAAHALSFLSEKLGHGKIDTTFLDQYTEGLEQDVKTLYDKANAYGDDFVSGKNSKAVTSYFADIKSAAQKAGEAAVATRNNITGIADNFDAETKKADAVKKKLEELKKQVDEFGLSRAEKAASEVANAGGDFGDQYQAHQYGEQLDKLEAIKKQHEEMANDAKKLWEDAQTPAEKYALQLDKINALLAAGEINQETADRARAKAEKELGKSKDAGIVQAGSQQAVKLVADFRRTLFGGHDNTPKSQLAEAKTTNKYLAILAGKDKKPDYAVARIS